jgi:peptide deformylase
MNEKLKTDISMLEIMTYGHPVLNRKADPIDKITDDILCTARNMVYTMHAAPGIGLAAPQINLSIRLITVDLSVGEKEGELFVLVNPEILERDGMAVMEEGCLSVPDVNENVTRPYRVTLRGYDLKGKEHIIEAEGMLARVFCHEVDHLDGRLFIDHISSLKKSIIRKKLRKQQAERKA